MQAPPDMSHDEPSLDPEWIEALRGLPSEQGKVSPKTDQAVMAMARQQLAEVRQHQPSRWVWRSVAAAAILALGIFVGHYMGRGQQPAQLAGQPSSHDDEAATILREVSALFPGQIRAIERDESGLQLVLADQPREQQGAGVVIEVMEDGQFRQIITFDGQQIELMGRFMNVETSPDGRVRLKGKGIEWTSDQPQPAPDEINIRARIL